MANTSRSVMQKKFKYLLFIKFIFIIRINDGASKHVEQSTLLEPANNATALVSIIHLSIDYQNNIIFLYFKIKHLYNNSNMEMKKSEK